LVASGFDESGMTLTSCLLAVSDWNHWHEYLLGGTAGQGKHVMRICAVTCLYHAEQEPSITIA
jgi:hypothetical protein